MEDLKITAPAGYEIDRENSTFDCIKFKKKEHETYNSIAKKLFYSNAVYYPDNKGIILQNCSAGLSYAEPNNCPTRKQAEKLMAINKLLNVAHYLNGDWDPEFSYYCGLKWYLCYERASDKISVYTLQCSQSPIVLFKTEDLARQAVKILGEDVIKLAIG